MNKRILWKKIKQRGPILQDNTRSLMRDEGNLYAFDEDGELTDEVMGWMPRTYTFEGVPAYDSYSALHPIGNKRNPFEFAYFTFDEDEGRADEWSNVEIRNPLHWQTEESFLRKIGAWSE